MIRGVNKGCDAAKIEGKIFGEDFSREGSAAVHGNTRYPELHDREALEALVNRYGTPGRIARALGCRRQLADAAMRRFNIKMKRYALSDEMKRSLRMRE